MAENGNAYRTIFIIFLVLGALTVGEFFVAAAYPSAFFLMAIALAKSVLIVYFFMHVYRLWRPEDHH
ncbi:MAG TPA: cytochrome C oxidase subunit IV family protein [Anaerolineae bacterium]|nr:cytochrome C oxidase subunit IV family protein [Anaerolineae bacterium]